MQSAAQQTAVALGRKLHKKFTLPPSKVALTVLNGNGVAGSAANASYLLAQKGYKILLPPSNQPANAPNWNYFHSKAYFDPSRGACKGAAQGVAKLVGSTDVEARPAKLAQSANGACVVLVVGSTFHNRLAPSFVQQAPPTHHPPVIRRDPGATRSSLAGVKRRVRFRLQLPTVLERSSNLDSGYGETPLRIYSLGGRPVDSTDLPDRHERVLGHPGDRLERRSDLRRPQPEPDRRRAALRPLLQRLPPAHGGAAERRRELLGREHAAGLALERDDALDRARAQADESLGCRR